MHEKFLQTPARFTFRQRESTHPVRQQLYRPLLQRGDVDKNCRRLSC